MWIDSHCHLNHTGHDDGKTPHELVDAARKAGIAAMVNINCRISDEFPSILQTAKEFDNVWCSVGTHPHDASKESEKAISEEKLIQIAQSDNNIIGIGESGLDYYYKNSEPGDQKVSFRKHIRACMATDMPLIVHARDADRDVIDIIREEKGQGSLNGVMHCFSSGAQMADEALELGFYISFSGIVTFKKSHELQDIARAVPMDRILVETDAPFLAPEPLRGQKNEPANVVHTGRFLAKLKDVSEEDMAKATTQNFYKLFTKAKLKVS